MTPGFITGDEQRITGDEQRITGDEPTPHLAATTDPSGRAPSSHPACYPRPIVTPAHARRRRSFPFVVALVATLHACSESTEVVIDPIPDAAGFDDWYQPVEDAAVIEEREIDDPTDVPALDAPPPPEDAPLATIDLGALDAPLATVDAGGVRDAGSPPPAPADAGSTPPPPPPPHFTTVFSTRRSNNAPDTAVEDAIVNLIRHAAPGSRIRVAIFSFTRNGPSAELIAAARRGIDVRIVFDGDAVHTTGSEVAMLRAGLGVDRVTVCGAPGTSCNGSGIMHHKTFLFSALEDGSRDVVVQASHNLTTTQLSMHNNAVIVRDDAALFAGYERTWNDLRRDANVVNYYRIDDGDRATRVYFFPRTDGDTAVSVINNVDCVAGSHVRVTMAFFTDRRVAVAQALAARRRAGCAVEAVIGDAEIRAGSSVLSTLRSAGVAVTLYPARAGGWTIHSKYLLVDSRYAGSTTPRRLVFTGSHNWTGPALDANDETLLRVEDDGVYNAFLADWNLVRAAASRP